MTRREQLAELLGSLSLATEAAVGVPPETTIRAAVVAVALARALQLSDEDCASAYLVSLLRYIGCSGFASETAWYGGGDDISLLGDLTPVDAAKPLATLATIVGTVGHRQGIEAMRTFDLTWSSAFSEARIESMRMMESDGAVLSGNWFHGGTHTQSLHTPAGAVPATGRRFEAPYCAMFEFDGDRIKTQRIVFDAGYVPTALGVR